MTNREKEILNLIRKNPLISQQEIGNILKIARSSVAVHIANLMKKGHIKGKGYVLNDREYITIIGGANVDIQGFPNENLTLKDSNPGKVKISLGGVGRNIAENISKLNIETKLITAIGNDPYGRKILSECKYSGIDMDSTLILNDISSSVYLSVLDETGDMKVAISDMNIMEMLDIDFIKSKTIDIKNSKAVVVDTNITKEVLKYLLYNFPNTDFFLDTVSTVKGMKTKDLIGKFHTIKPNKIEAESISGISINSESDIKRVLRYFIDMGVKRVFISMGENGVYYGNKEEMGYLPSPEIKVVNATGAGDAFMAGLIYSYLNDFNLEKSCKFSMAAAILTLSHENTINPNITVENIKKVEERIK